MRWLVLAVLLAGCGSQAVPLPPPRAVASGGALAVAAPGLEQGPVLAGDAVLWSAGGSVWRSTGVTTRLTPERPGPVRALHASAQRVALARRVHVIQSCTSSETEALAPECTPLPGGAIEAGPPLRVLRRTTTAADLGPGCGQGIAVAELLGVSGTTVVYKRRLRCVSPLGRSRYDIVAQGVVYRGPVAGAKVAGRYLAVARASGRMIVIDLRTGRVAYRTMIALPRGSRGWALSENGTVVALTAGRDRLDAHSPRAPGARPLVQGFAPTPLPASGIPDSGPPVVAAAGGHVAYVTADALMLRGRARPLARFTATSRYGGLALDRERLAWTTLTYRPADRGSLCLGVQRPYALSWAPVIEVRRIDALDRSVTAPHVPVPPGTETCEPYED